MLNQYTKYRTEELLAKLCVKNIQQLALIDKQYLIEDLGSQKLFRDYPQIISTIAMNTSWHQEQIQYTPMESLFFSFNELNEYFIQNNFHTPSTLEIIGPSLSGKTYLAQNICLTHLRQGKRVYVLSLFDISWKYFLEQSLLTESLDYVNLIEVQIIHSQENFFYILSLILEELQEKKKHLDLLIIENIQSLFYHDNQLGFYETCIKELGIFLNKFKVLFKVLIIITNCSKVSEKNLKLDEEKCKLNLRKKKLIRLVIYRKTLPYFYYDIPMAINY